MAFGRTKNNRIGRIIQDRQDRQDKKEIKRPLAEQRITGSGGSYRIDRIKKR
jgi:hypothetical protein